VPPGPRQLKEAFAADGHVNPRPVAERDGAQAVSAAKKRGFPPALVAPSILPGANAGRNGAAVKLQPLSLPLAVKP
jgi:hypothetical protein